MQNMDEGGYCHYVIHGYVQHTYYRGADKSLARRGGKQATATKDFNFHISYL